MKRIVMILLAAMLLTACGVGKKTQKEEVELDLVASQEAVNLFTEGQLAEMSNDYQTALRNYYKALLIDSTNEVVLNAIGGAHIKMEHYGNAILYLRRSAHLDSSNMETWSLLGEAYLGQQKYPEAARAFEKAVSIQPQNMNLRRYLIYIYTNSGENHKLLEQYLSILNHVGFDPDIAMKAAGLLMLEEKTVQAEDIYKRVLHANPQNVTALMGLAQVSMFRGDTLAAEENYQKALEIQPDNPDVDFNYSRLLRSQQDWDALIALYLVKLNADSTDNVARINIAEAYYWKKDYTRAKEYLSTYYGMEGLHSGITQLIGKVEIELENYETAEEYLQSAFKTSADNPGIYIDLAYCYDKMGKVDSSIVVLEKAVENFSTVVVFFRYLGQQYSQKKEYGKAITVLEKALRLEANDINSLAILANLYQEIGQVAKSDSVYEKALVIDPDDATVLNNYAYGLAERDTLLIRAHKMSIKAVKAEPENTSFLDTIAWILFKLGKEEEARDYILKAIEYDEDGISSEIYIHAGQMFKSIDKNRAADYLRIAIERDPESTEAKELLESISR